MSMTKREAMQADLVRKPGSKSDPIYNTCAGCKHVVFWRLTTLCDGPATYCDWCMAKRGWKRMPGSRPLVAARPRRTKKKAAKKGKAT